MISRTLTVLLLSTAPIVLSAQSRLRGTLIEHSTERPMHCYTVVLLDSAGAPIDSAVTARGGAFEFTLSDRALFRLRVGTDSVSGVLTAPERMGTGTLLTRSYRIPWLERGAVRPDPAKPVAQSRFRLARGSALPEYPPELLRDGVSGYVLFAYAIDTLGRVDSSSALPLRATHALFARAVQDAFPRMRFEPWTPAGAEHCALLQQRFDFRLEP